MFDRVWLRHMECACYFARSAVLILSIWTMGCNPSSKTSIENTNRSSTTAKAKSADLSILYEDSTNALSIHHQYHNGEESNQFAYIESFGGGVAVLDYDRDGLPDLFFTGGGRIDADHSLTPLPGSLWKNEAAKRFSNVTEVARASFVGHYSIGVSSGDVNNDGFPDLLVTGYGGLQYFVNQGDGTFLESSLMAGLADKLWSTSAGFGDLNNDGTLDIYIAHNTDWSWDNHPQCKTLSGSRDLCAPSVFKGLPDQIYLNNNDGSFRPIGMNIEPNSDGRGLAVMLVDLNQDSKLDIYVANDTTYNFVFINRGNEMFDEIGIDSGAGLDERGNPNGSMGIAVFDFDGNLQPDLWVTNYENETCALYLNDGNSNFRCATASTGIMSLGTLFVSFGTVAGDLDLDGDEDLVVANGHVMRFPNGNTTDQFPLLLVNAGDGKLVRQKADPSNYFGKKWRGRGVAAVDIDLDGDLDLAISHVNQDSVVLENKTKTNGQWCTLELVGTHSNRDSIGSRIVFKTNKKSYLRTVVGGGSYLSQNPYSVHFGFPESETLEQCEITWPDGAKQVIANPKVNCKTTIREPSDSSSRTPR
jgi:enediyne biosynthesis protein E4